MIKFLTLAVVFFSTAFVCAADNITELPGLSRDVSVETAIPRPDAERVISRLRNPLKLTPQQEKRITELVGKKGREFDKQLSQYDEAAEEAKKWRFKANDLKHAMSRINADMANDIRQYLDDEQRLAYDEMLTSSVKTEPPVAKNQQVLPGENVQPPVKKRRLVRRKRVVPVEPPAEEVKQTEKQAAAEPPAALEDRVMVDDENAVDPPPVKRRVKRKVTSASQAERAKAKPATPKEELPAESEESSDAGSYP